MEFIYTKIVDNLFLGSYNDIIKGYYEKENIDIIINVAKECHKIDFSIEYYKYSYLDSPEENISESFDEVADLIDSYVSQDKKVFIHCYAGKSRSATFVIIYLMKHLGFDLNSAYTHVMNLRDIYPNIGFINQMVQYEKETTGKTTLDYDSVVIEYMYGVTGFYSKEEIKLMYEKFNKDIDLTMNEIFRS